MRFRNDGPEIPSELIAAQERGEAVFVCGAGISMTAGLPSFKKLVEDVYKELDESWSNQPAEADAMANHAYDRVLRSLERRLVGTNARMAQGHRQKIRDAVRKCLTPTTLPLTAHRDILTLSRDASLSSRIVTTNFDTLFERAWKADYRDAINSYAGPALPGPLTARFDGILHLHGRVSDALLSLDDTDLVLTSAEFGEAYLRSGWATRYVYDLVRATSVVIVGYTADDPPMRYLLQAIDADRERFSDLKNVYAFVAANPDDENRERELWTEKGTIPILYSKHGVDDHSLLYDTLTEWATYSNNPTAWRTVRFASHVEQEPATANRNVLEEVKWLLSHGDAPQILAETNPSPAWMPTIRELGISRDIPELFAQWIIKNFTSREMLERCIDYNELRGEMCSKILHWLGRHHENVEPLFVRAWRVFLRSRQTYSERYSVWHLMKRVAASLGFL